MYVDLVNPAAGPVQQAGADQPGSSNKGRRSRRKVYVGMDVHKAYLQIAVMSANGTIVSNERVENTLKDIENFLKTLPGRPCMVMESSSVSHNIFLHLRRAGHDITMSDPFKTKAIAYSKKKTDKVDAATLAYLLRGGLIPACHMPSDHTLEMRQLVRYRKHLTRSNIAQKRKIHSILLGGGTRIGGTPFSKAYVRELRELHNYSIDSCLEIIDAIQEKMGEADKTIRDEVENGEDSVPRLLSQYLGWGTIRRWSYRPRSGRCRGFLTPTSSARMRAWCRQYTVRGERRTWAA